jgi:polysaccharide pyruvyl transferase WcaK-like protein
MKVLHVASFRGNIGDNANHAGFRPWFATLAGQPVEWREFEIRDVYRKDRAFDMSFAEEANAADLVIIGGGNYFELWVESSPTGTSISISDNVLDAIKTPVFVNALGVDDGQGYTEETLGRFRRFLGRLLASQQYLVSVRNDGAMAALKRHAGDMPIERVLHLPDGGFFSRYQPAQRQEGFCVGINLAGDMLEQRFPGGNKLDYQGFLAEMAETIAQLGCAYPGLRLIFFPHIFRDLAVCADLLALLPDKLRRGQVRVAAYDSGPPGEHAFTEYLTCDVVLAMRFHSNVVPIGHGIPTIGLYCYDQIKHLYDELESPDSVVDVSRADFGSALLNRLALALNDPDAAKARVAAMNRLVTIQRDKAGQEVSIWMRQRGLA